MKKCLLLAALIIVSQLKTARAQEDLFNAPDTVCIRQPINLTSNVLNASSYYWGFCSGFLFNNPVGTNLGTLSGILNGPSAVELMKDDTSYFAFIANGTNRELFRLDYGNSMSNTPIITNFGNLNNTLPVETQKLFLTKDDRGNWFMFACGGNNRNNSTLARFDFGSSLRNAPNSVNFGNLNNVFSAPRGVFVAKEKNKWFGYVANFATDELIRLDFDTNISLTPATVNLGNGFGFFNPTDMVPVKDTNGWRVFATNYSIGTNNSSITRLDILDSLNATPAGINLGNINNRLFGPTSITYARDCDFQHLFVTNAVSSDFIRINMDSLTGGYRATAFTGVGNLITPSSISRIIRERDNVYMLITNSASSSLSEIVFEQCTNASITSSDSLKPPTYAYDQPKTYNVFFMINEGRPDMQVQCKQIVALPLPQVTFETDRTICQGDTVNLRVQAFGSLSSLWYPNVSISNVDSNFVRVWPEFSTEYHVVLPYRNGCVVDTPVTITVNKIKADAGPDRTIADGARTMLGGPGTTEGPEYTHFWFPDQFISNTVVTNPVVNPPFDYTYYLRVTDNKGCVDVDTVVVRVGCDGINLPNAFAPESANPVTRRFGLLNKQFVKLNYFRIYDRWGKEVFSTTDLTKQWDGTVNGTPAPYGVYIWELDAVCGGEESRRLKESGNVTLIR